MWPFSKKQPAAPAPPAGLPAEDNWSIAESESDGLPMIIRLNTSAKEYAGHPELPVRLGIAIPLNDPNESELPDEPEMKQLDAIEALIFDGVEPAGRVVLVVTTSGMREVVSYVRSSRHAEEILERLRNAVTTHEVHHHIEDDPGWEELSRVG